MRQKSAEGSSQGDRTFDFKYKIDISDRKGKTGQTFKQQSGYDFDDFKDFRQDKTLKSQILSQRKYLPSELNKKSQQSLFITQNHTQISIRKKGGSFIGQNYFKNQNSYNLQQSNFPSHITSPKFVDEKQKQSKSASNNFFSNKVINITQTQKLTPTSKIQSLQQQNSINNKLVHSIAYDKIIQSNPNNNIIPSNNYNPQPKNKSPTPQQSIPSTSRIAPQQQYKQILSSIQYYQAQNTKLDYQTSKVLQQILKYQNLLSNNTFQAQLQKLTDQTYSLNSQISNKKNIERKLMEDYNNLEEQFQEVVISVENYRFQRPDIIRDQTKAIIDEINSLKIQFDALKRDQGSLNLSNTLPNPATSNLPPSIQNRLPFNTKQVNTKKLFNPQQTIMRQYLRQISSYSTLDPNYIYNIKMMTVKDQWKIYENSQICINYCSRDYPAVEIRIGNKSIRTLYNFVMKQGESVIAENQLLLSKSYYVHGLRMIKISQPFTRLQISYQILQNDKNITNKSQILLQKQSPSLPKKLTFYIPTLPLKHGQFIPITKKQYQNQTNLHMNILQEVVSLQKQIDCSIIKNNLEQLTLYFPNLLIEKENQKGEEVCKGIFKLWNSSEGSLVKIKKRDGIVSLYVKNNMPFLLHSLEFLLTAIF